MRLGIKAKQIAAVAPIVGLAVLALRALHLTPPPRVVLHASQAGVEVLADEPFGSIRIGVSTVLMRQELNASLRPAINVAIASLLIAVIVAALLAQLFLRPINVIRSGLTRLGKGELGVTLDLNQNDEFGDLGTFFNTVSQQLSEQRDPRQLARKLVALSRLTAGLAHEVKNPLNAMMIHLELLRTKLRRPVPVAAGAGITLAERPENPDTMQHVEIIENEI